jgi:xanthine dehydrogenase molybdopterin-binding subunit B
LLFSLRKIDASEALKMPGVVAFFSAKDIPGENNIGTYLTLIDHFQSLLLFNDLIQSYMKKKRIKTQFSI